MEHRTSRNSDKLPSILILILFREFVASVVIVLFLNRLGFVGLIDVGGDGFRMSGRLDSDLTFITSNDEVTKVPPVLAVKPVFQPLIRE